MAAKYDDWLLKTRRCYRNLSNYWTRSQTFTAHARINRPARYAAFYNHFERSKRS